MIRSLFIALALLPCAILSAGEIARPLFRDLVGINGHTVAFKPELYAPVCGVVRDYHPVNWDLPEDTSKLPDWPFARNRVSWEQVYGSWHKAGLRISVCLQFDEMKDKWKDPVKDAFAYGKSFAQNFGPGGKWPFVEWIELGNEPGLYDDAKYRVVFEAMARGIREGNPQMKIATCNVEVGPSDRYWKGVDCFKGFEGLYDVLHTHRYAIAEQWPVWRRTYPEDPKVPFLSSIQKLIDWRNANAAGKPVWVTEFGWDSSTKKPDPKGEWAKWTGSTDEQQAQWLVRSFLLFSGMGVEKAFVYFFNDKDEPKLHAASGITRNYEPKPSYHAIAWMLKSLSNYRFSKVIQQSLEEGYVYEFTSEKAGEPIIWAAWHPKKSAHELKLETKGMKVLKAEVMPLAKGDAQSLKVPEGATINLSISEKPTLLWMELKP
jgi:exo-beta-1,3-glucanase (GH17 family)